MQKKKYTFLDVWLLSMQACPVITLIKTLLIFVNGVKPILLVFSTANIIDVAIAYAQGESDMSALVWPLVILSAVVSFDLLENAVKQMMNVWHRLRLYVTLRAKITRHRANLAYAHIENSDTYELIRRVSDIPAERVSGAFDGFAWTASMVLNIVSLLFMLFMNIGWAALIIIVAAIPIQYVSLKNGKKRYDSYMQSQKIMRRADYLSEVLTQREAAEERTMFRYTDTLSDRYVDLSREANEIMFVIQRKTTKNRLISDVLTLLLSLGIAGALVPSVLSGATELSMFVTLVGTVFSVVNYTAGRLPRQIFELTEFSGYLRDLTAFAALETVKGAETAPNHPAPALQSIEFRDVSFAYPGTDFKVLNRLCFTIRAGQHMALVGSNGAGKSTIIKLLTGLYDNYTGQIFINGRELREIAPEEYKAFFAVAHQDFAKYSLSLRENIALGTGENLHEGNPDISKAVELLNIHTVAEVLPDGMDTILGKAVADGQDLSGGQWQRVALARTVASPAPVTILDEPTAALDPIAESEMYSRFGTISENKTTIFISHRLGSIKLSDTIIVLDGGAVCEQGTHDELMARKGLYAEMYDAQRSWYL